MSQIASKVAPAFSPAPAGAGVPPSDVRTAPAPGRVVLVTDGDVFAGTEQHMLTLATALAAEGVSVAVACPGGSPLAVRAATAGLAVYPIARRRFASPLAAFSLRRLLVDGRADVLHAHNGRARLAAALAVRLAGRGRCVATQHFISPSSAGRRGLKRLGSNAVHQFMDGSTRAVIAISDSARDAMRSRRGGAAGGPPTTVVANGIDPPTADATAAAAVRTELGLRPDQPMVLCAARLQPEKGIPTLVEAMATVRRDVPDAVCVLAGEGDLRADIERQVTAAGLTDAVRLVGFRTDVPTVMAACDLFVLPAPAEPFGLVLLEAMAAARPVVAVAAGGPAEIVVDGQTGRLVPPNDPPAMASAIVGYLRDPAARAAAAAAGRDRWHDRYTAGRMARATLAVYQAATG